MLYAIVYDYFSDDMQEVKSIKISKKGKKITAELTDGTIKEFRKTTDGRYCYKTSFIQIHSMGTCTADITPCIVKAYRGLKVILSEDGKDSTCCAQ